MSASIEILELLNDWEDGDLIHLLARGVHAEDLFRSECERHLSENFWAGYRIARITKRLVRRIPCGDRGDRYNIENVTGRGAFEATIADIEYAEVAS